MMKDERPTVVNDGHARAARLLRDAAALIEGGRTAEALALQTQVSALLSTPPTSPAEGDTYAGRHRSGTEVLASTARSTRQDIIDALNDLGVPSSPRAIADYAGARFGTKLESRLFASLRRDERRAWGSPRSHRPVYVVPTLSVATLGRSFRLLAVRGKLALSDWPLEIRLIGPWGERVDHLKATVNLARQALWLQENKPEEAACVTVVLAQFAATVPGAVDRTVLDPNRIIRAARDELDLLAPEDEAWRSEAAMASRTVVSPEEQLWGTAVPYVVEAQA